MSVSTFAVIKPECLLIHVPLKVEWLDRDISSIQITLEQAPEILQPVCVNPAVNVLFHVVHGVMDIAPVQFVVSSVTVSVNGRAVLKPA